MCSRYRNHPWHDPPSLFVLSGAGFACEQEGSCLRLTAAGECAGGLVCVLVRVSSTIRLDSTLLETSRMCLGLCFVNADEHQPNGE